MAVSEKITCDVCGIQKGEANHWIMVHFGNGATPRFLPWDGQFREYDAHLCGESCAGKMLAQSIASWSAQSQIENVAPDPALEGYRKLAAAADGTLQLDEPQEESNHG